MFRINLKINTQLKIIINLIGYIYIYYLYRHTKKVESVHTLIKTENDCF